MRGNGLLNSLLDWNMPTDLLAHQEHLGINSLHVDGRSSGLYPFQRWASEAQQHQWPKITWLHGVELKSSPQPGVQSTHPSSLTTICSNQCWPQSGHHVSCSWRPQALAEKLTQQFPTDAPDVLLNESSPHTHILDRCPGKPQRRLFQRWNSPLTNASLESPWKQTLRLSVDSAPEIGWRLQEAGVGKEGW